MLQLKTIQVPKDCSDHSKISLLYASRLEKEFGTRVTLLYMEKHAEEKKVKTATLKSEDM